jgi:hypothetical protein
MSERAKAVSFKGQVSHRHEANSLLTEPGATVLVHRGVPRSVAMACPDGCGEQLTINLDERAGPAWRHYTHGPKLSLFPSVWRDSGCHSHFIVWNSKIYWCDLQDPWDTPSDDVLDRVQQVLGYELVPYVSIADRLGMVPWAALSACSALTRKGLAERGVGKKENQFRRKPT